MFRLKKELNYAAIKDIRKLFKQEKEAKPIKARIHGEMLSINNPFEHEKGEGNYYKPV